MISHIDSLALALARRREQGYELWAELKQDHMNQPTLMRRYCACMRLCEWLQKKIRELA